MQRVLLVLFGIGMGLQSHELMAHPGHGNPAMESATVTHYLTEPMHLLPVVTLIAVFAATILARKIASSRKSSSYSSGRQM